MTSGAPVLHAGQPPKVGSSLMLPLGAGVGAGVFVVAVGLFGRQWRKVVAE